MKRYADVVRRTVICPCGSDTYHRTIADDGAPLTALTRIWRCDNCRRETPRKVAAHIVARVRRDEVTR